MLLLHQLNCLKIELQYTHLINRKLAAEAVELTQKLLNAVLQDCTKLEVYLSIRSPIDNYITEGWMEQGGTEGILTAAEGLVDHSFPQHKTVPVPVPWLGVLTCHTRLREEMPSSPTTHMVDDCPLSSHPDFPCWKVRAEDHTDSHSQVLHL